MVQMVGKKAKIFKGEEAIKNNQGEWAHVKGVGRSSKRGNLVSATLTSQGERRPTNSLSGTSGAQYTGDRGPQVTENFIMEERS